MPLRYDSLDEEVRRFMVEEIALDEANGKVYMSSRLNEEGQRQWVLVLRDASAQGTDAALADVIRRLDLLKQEEQRRKPKGGFTTARVPHTAPETLADGEFNRFYARAVCRSVLESGGTEVEIYRGKEVDSPRPESEAMIGRRVSAKALLEDLRTSQGVEPALGIPPGPNSGLTIRRV